MMIMMIDTADVLIIYVVKLAINRGNPSVPYEFPAVGMVFRGNSMTFSWKNHDEFVGYKGSDM